MCVYAGKQVCQSETSKSKMLGFPRMAGVGVAGPGLPVVMVNCWSLPNTGPQSSGQDSGCCRDGGDGGQPSNLGLSLALEGFGRTQ